MHGGRGVVGAGNPERAANSVYIRDAHTSVTGFSVQDINCKINHHPLFSIVARRALSANCRGSRVPTQQTRAVEILSTRTYCRALEKVRHKVASKIYMCNRKSKLLQARKMLPLNIMNCSPFRVYIKSFYSRFFEHCIQIIENS